MPVEISEGTTPVLEWGDLSVQMLQTADGELRAQFSLPVSNAAASGCAGNLVTYILMPADGSDDIRHWEILSLSAGCQDTLSIRYAQLTEGATYTLYVLCPWTIRAQITFTATAEGAADGIELVPSSEASASDNRWYDLQGREVSRPHRGIYLQRGKKTAFR